MTAAYKTSLSRGRLTWILISLLAIIISWWGVSTLENGLDTIHLSRDGVPLYFLAPEEANGLPAVIAAHGFSGSKQLMLGYGYTLAHAGYGVMLLDFAGHGANEMPLDDGGAALQEDLDAAYTALLDQAAVDPEHIALLGHSMGSGAVLRAGVDQPDRYQAVVAISPTIADVDDSRPPNLMLQAGSLEGRFVANARELLEKAGGPNNDFISRHARSFTEIPGVEHITILFSHESQRLALDWLNKSFGITSSTDYRDGRLAWYGLHVLGWLSLVLALKPLLPSKESAGGRRSTARQWVGLFLGVLAATGLLPLLSSWFDLNSFLGFSIGGALSIWVLIFGSIWLGIGFRPALPGLRSLVWGAALFAVLWLMLGLMAHFTWLQWFLVPRRLLLWPLLAIAALPWKLAAGYAVGGGSFWKRVSWWLGQSVFIVSGLLLTAFVVPGLFFLILVVPVLPLVLALEGIAGSVIDDPWSYGLGSALFFGWLISALFALV